MYTTYIIRGRATGRYYIGSTADFERRLAEHNRGHTLFDKVNEPFEVIRVEKYSTKREALKREGKIKSFKGGNSFRKLV